MNNKEIFVSVYCLCYNHEKYIRKCLDGFVMQKTNFIYEVIVHDDASTDNSANIIKEYEKKYPDIIKPIYQKVNQYSQGIKIFTTHILPKCKGKYIAICEGDDYWTDENKLQIQFDYMEIHVNCSICGHAFSKIHEDGTIMENIFSLDSIINVSKVIMFDNMPQTATLMYRKKLISLRPSFFSETTVGDYPLMLYMSTKGEFHCINKNMSCYRLFVPGSWVNSTAKDPKKFIIPHLDAMKVFLEKFNDYTNKEYENMINLKISQFQLQKNILERSFNKIISNEYFIKKYSFKWKISTILKCVFPRLHNAFKIAIERLKHGE
ncbi:MAG: glycosyltransferase [Clostridia bacterium]